MKDHKLVKLARIYQKLKGSLFLRLVPNYLKYKFGEEDIDKTKYINIDDDTYLIVLNKDMSFGQWLDIKGVRL